MGPCSSRRRIDLVCPNWAKDGRSKYTARIAVQHSVFSQKVASREVPESLQLDPSPWYEAYQEQRRKERGASKPCEACGRRINRAASYCEFCGAKCTVHRLSVDDKGLAHVVASVAAATGGLAGAAGGPAGAAGGLAGASSPQRAHLDDRNFLTNYDPAVKRSEAQRGPASLSERFLRSEGLFLSEVRWER